MSGEARGRRRRRAAAATLAILGACAPAAIARPAAAETLMDAIALAYQTNPTLRSERAGERAVGETYVQARAALGPQATLNGTGGYSVARVQGAPSFFSAQGTDTTYRGSTGTATLSVVQPVFNFGATNADIRATRSSVLAGREELRNAETELIGKVVTAYMDVRRDRDTVRILREALTRLGGQFEETRAKTQAGALTRTDLAEAQARLLSLQTQLDGAQGRLAASNAAYVAVVGQAPEELQAPPPLTLVPTKIEDAFASANANNAQILSAVGQEQAARERIRQAKSAYGPSLSVRVDAGVQPNLPYVPGQYDRNVTVTAVLSQPLFTSGMSASKVREAADRDAQAMLQIDVARRQVVQNVSQAWGQLTSTRIALDHAKAEVAAYETAVEGTEIEERVGRRSTFELVNNEVELASARISLISTEHDEYLAQASVLAGMGLLEARYLTPGAALYDPDSRLKRNLKKDAAPWEGAVQGLNTTLAPRATAPSLTSPGRVAETGSAAAAQDGLAPEPAAQSVSEPAPGPAADQPIRTGAPEP
ncbi:MAG TPA: TolC family outer membrane protein [Caulobacteraceae bacterium]|jgi:outer membrane protein|nr:TolC family outer membrane protein [Caulobacteraceae bacterium]